MLHKIQALHAEHTNMLMSTSCMAQLEYLVSKGRNVEIFPPVRGKS